MWLVVVEVTELALLCDFQHLCICHMCRIVSAYPCYKIKRFTVYQKFFLKASATVNSVVLHQTAHLCRLFWIYLVANALRLVFLQQHSIRNTIPENIHECCIQWTELPYLQFYQVTDFIFFFIFQWKILWKLSLYPFLTASYQL